MAKRGAIVSAQELVGFIQNELEPYLGDAAFVADHRPLLNGILEQYFLGASVTLGTSVEQAIVQYGVPTDIARRIDTRVTQQLTRLIQRAFVIIYPSRHYVHQILGDGDILVYEHDLTTLVPKDSVPTPEEMEEGLDRGDWYPERQRRTLGFA